MVAMLNEPAEKKSTTTPIIRPTSPVRVVRNAFTAASAFGFSSHQWPISTNEHSPTSSHPTSNSIVLSATTSRSIDAVNKLSSAKKCVKRRSSSMYLVEYTCTRKETSVTTSNII